MKDRLSQSHENGVASYANDLAEPALEQLVDQLAHFFDRFGFKRNLGRIWAVLYLAPQPLTQANLGELLGLSTGLISSALKELEQWGAIRPIVVRGARSTHYEAEHRLLRIVASILTQRELPAVRRLRETAAGVHLNPRYRDRARSIERLCRLYESLTDMVGRISRLPSAALDGAMRLVEATRFAGDSKETRTH